MTTYSGRHDYTRESALDWAIRHTRADLAAMPPRLRAETITRAYQLAAQHPQSYLAHYVHLLYGGMK